MKNHHKTALVIIGIILVVSSAIITYATHLLYSIPPDDLQGEFVNFTIEKGESLESISRRLAEHRLIVDPVALRLAAFFSGESRKIKAGKHRLARGLNAFEVFEQLKLSPQKEFLVITIPEGKDIFEISEIINNFPVSGRERFIELALRPDLVLHLDPSATSLEGFLFPDTYHLPVDADIEKLIEMMLSRNNEVLTRDLIEAFKAQKLTLKEGIILASLIAKEAGNEEEMPEISSVFHNRLERQMRLECDPTFIYAAKLAGVWDNKIHQSDIHRQSPYNTYLYTGLPPGPIGNPGKAALHAAANPAETSYIFFVAKSADQSEGHYFSENLRQHNKYVQIYRKNRKEAEQNY